MRRIHLLLGVLVVTGAVLPISLWLRRKPAPPPSSAPLEMRYRYWQERLKKDVSDIDAYVHLGTLKESQGFYFAARRHLLAARALGAPDTQISGPLGRALSHLAQEPEARVELEKAMALAPDSVEPVLNLAGFYSDQSGSSLDSRGQDEAKRVLNEWIARHPDIQDSEVLERLTLALLACEDEKNAYTLALKLIDVAPGEPGALSLAARCAFSAGDLTKARSFMEKLLPVAPDPIGAYFLYGLILQRQKNYDAALKAWQHANALNPFALDLYDKIGQEYARRGDFKRAAYALERIANSDQQYSSAMKAARAYEKAGIPERAAYWDAVAAGFLGDFEKALTLAKQAAASKQPDLRRQGLIAVAEAYKGLKRNAEYQKTIEEVTAPGTVEDLLLRAYAYQHLETPETLEKRLVCLRQAAEKSPEQRAAITLQVAEQLRRTGRRDEAEAEMEKALQTQSDDPELVRRLAGFYLERSALGERLQKATQLAEKATQLAPQDEQAWLLLGQCYAARNELAQAAACFEHVIDLEAGYGPGYLELARVYAKQGNAEGNRQMMQLYSRYVALLQKHETFKTRARSPKATYEDMVNYARILLAAGDLEGAMGELERALRKKPDSTKVKQVLKRLYVRLGHSEQLLSLEAHS